MKNKSVYCSLPIGHCIDARVRVPGSKSITQRAMVAAALAEGTSILMHPLESEDTLLLRDVLSALGISFANRDASWVVEGKGGKIEPCGKTIYMGNNGTGMRFLASIVALGQGKYLLSGTERMEERPIEPLLEALRAWGTKARSIKGTGCPPVEIEGGGLEGGDAKVSASMSSQFLSSLLLVAPYCRRPAKIILDGPLASKPYVDITLSVMKAFGVEVEEKDNAFFVPKVFYQPKEYRIEGDASSASYFWAAAAVTGGRVTVENIPEKPLQGDAAFLDILVQMGCRVKRDEDGSTVEGPGEGGLFPIDIDMKMWPDIVPTLAVVAAFARGRTIIRNVAHLRIKETDRLRAVATELSRMGARVEELEDGLVIEGGVPLHGAEIRTYDDHRIAMAFAVAGLNVKGVEIEDPECVKKSFPDFWNVWKRMSD